MPIFFAIGIFDGFYSLFEGLSIRDARTAGLFDLLSKMIYGIDKPLGVIYYIKYISFG